MRHLAAAIAIACIVLLAPLSSAATAPSLDGRTFIVDLTNPEGKADKDTIAFEAGTGDSVACHAYGFGRGKATYSGTDPITFTFSTTSAKEGTMDWTGTVTGSHIVGSAVWTKEGKGQTMKFVGEESKPGAAAPEQK